MVGQGKRGSDAHLLVEKVLPWGAKLGKKKTVTRKNIARRGGKKNLVTEGRG